MKKFFVSVFSFCFLLVPFASHAEVQFSKYQWPPMWNGSTNVNSMPLTDYAFDIVDTFNSGSTDYSFIRVMTPGPQPFCSSLDDAGCQEVAKKYGWWIIRLLPPCTSDSQKTECIEGLSVTNSSGKTIDYVNSYIYKRNTFPADPAHGLGEGSGTSTWVDPSSPDSGNGFAITVSGDAGGNFSDASFPLDNFAATVTPYRTTRGNYDVPVVTIVNQQARFETKPGMQSPPTCLWISPGKCGEMTDFPSDAVITLKLHLPSDLATWVLGRLGSPSIAIDEIGGSGSLNYQRVSVSAKPMTVPMVGGKVSIADASAAVKKEWSNNICPECEHGIWAMNAPSSGESAFTIMNAFRPFLNDKSMVSIPAWSISSLKEKTPSIVKCTKTGSISGLVTTNASAYQGAPPVFDGTSLNYKVGAMHYTDDGSIFKGTYDLLMPAKTAECLYGYSSAPVSATVSVTGEDGISNVATTTLSERDGWLHLAAEGFTFSNPTIKVKFARPASTSSPQSSNQTQSPSNTASQVTKSLWCAKGTAKKKVTGPNPVCPKGYKKIADPTRR